jgi:F0F1-type ATP synthase membrane subunit b/b'
MASTEISVISHFTDSIFTTFIYSIIAFFFLCLSASYFENLDKMKKIVEKIVEKIQENEKNIEKLQKDYNRHEEDIINLYSHQSFSS